MAGNIDKKRNELIEELESAPAMHVGARAEILSSIALSREFAATFLRAICEQFGSYSVAGICEALARQRAICYGARDLKTSFKISSPPAYFEDNNSYFSIMGVSIGLNPNSSNTERKLSITCCLSIFSSGVKSLTPFAFISSIFFILVIVF